MYSLCICISSFSIWVLYRSSRRGPRFDNLARIDVTRRIARAVYLILLKIYNFLLGSAIKSLAAISAFIGHNNKQLK